MDYKEGIYSVPVILPLSLESRRNEFSNITITAQKRLRDFSIKNGWGDLVKENFMERVEIYDDKDKFDQTLIEVFHSDPSFKVPKTYSAVLENKILIAVSPELYSRNYPDGNEDRSYEKLMIHEIAHRLHVRILNGNEEAMGPVWFFEGFAIYAAAQFENKEEKLNTDEIWKIVNSTDRGSYKKYNTVFRYFLQKTSIHELIDHAGDDDFIGWLKKLD